MEFLVPVLASAGFLALVNLVLKLLENSTVFRQWKAQRKASVEDELHGELKRQNERLEKENERLRLEVDQWQEKYYRLLVEKKWVNGKGDQGS